MSHDYGVYGSSAEWQPVSAGKLDPWACLTQGQATFPDAIIFLKLKSISCSYHLADSQTMTVPPTHHSCRGNQQGEAHTEQAPKSEQEN